MVKFNKKIFLALVSLWLTNAFLSNVNAQENTNTYYKFGINLSTDYLTTNNESNSIGYKFNDLLSYNFGVSYKIIEKTNYRLFTSFSIRNYTRVNEVSIKGEDVGIPEINSIGGTEELSPFTQFKLQTSFDYYLSKRNKINTYFGIGPELIFYPEDPVTGHFLITTPDNDTEIGYTENGNSKESEFYFGINGTFGIEFKTKHVLINPYILYHYEPRLLFESTITTQNLYVSENTVSKHSINNSYWSFGINFFPSKNLFKRKNSKP